MYDPVQQDVRMLLDTDAAGRHPGADGAVPERDDIAADYTWDVEDLFASRDAWEEEYEAVDELVDEFAAYEGRTTESGEALQEVLELRNELSRRYANVRAYATFLHHTDTREEEFQRMQSRVSALGSKKSEVGKFVKTEIRAADEDEVRRMVAETDSLGVYEDYIDGLFRMQEHGRSKEVERVFSKLGRATGAASSLYNTFANADLSFPAVEHPEQGEIEITQANFTGLQRDLDRDFRQEVYETFYDEWADYRNTVSEMLEREIIKQNDYADLRNYDSSREMALKGNKIPGEVYDQLVDLVEDNLDVLHRHARMKRDAIGADEFGMWDVYMPMTPGEGPVITYDEAIDHLLAAVEPLGEDYVDGLADGIQSGWVDVYENQGKRAGAYCSGTYDTHPYVLLNYHDDLESLFTFAHEMGHAMHRDLTDDNQPYPHIGSSTFTAETASTLNEQLLTHHLLETADDPEFRGHVLDHALERFRNTLYRQTMFADFEHQVHERVGAGDPLSADILDDMYGGLKEDFYDGMGVDDRIAREWMRIPHFYYGYYVFQYATGISAAASLSQDILDEGEEAADRYVDNMLKQGTRDYPLELLRDAGVDMASPEPVLDAIWSYHSLLNEMEDALTEADVL